MTTLTISLCQRNVIFYNDSETSQVARNMPLNTTPDQAGARGYRYVTIRDDYSTEHNNRQSITWPPED